MNVFGKLIMSAAFALAPLCACAQDAAPAPSTQNTSRRTVLCAVSSSNQVAIERLEAKRGAPFGDDELLKVIGTEAFRLEHEKAETEFCAAPEHKNVFACVRHTARQ